MSKKLNLRLDKNELFRQAKNIFLVVFGTAVLAFATGVFIIPFDLVSGGMVSIGIILNKLIPIEALTVDVYITIITWVFFFIGLIALGRAFAMKTVISTVLYPPLMSLFMRLASPDFLGGFFNLQSSEHASIAIILAAIFSGAGVGAGCAITFLGGGSTGGVDIVALAVSKRFKRIKSSSVMFCIDSTLILLGMFIIRDLVISLLGIVSAFIAATVIDRIFLGRNRAFIANIVSEKYEEINAAIIENVHRTTTVMSVVGGYSKSEKHMLMVSFTMRQYSELITTVNRIDKNAFITVHSAHEINGEGWTYGEHD